MAYLNGTTDYSSINTVKLASSGQILYVSVNGTDGKTRIEKYNISTGSFIFLRSYA
jgi:hypothetical protein